MSEQPADVGSTLRQARVQRGQSLEVVQQQTRIPKKLLEALENNRFDEFPATVYLRGFLKNYCDHLDVDFDPLWAQIDPNRPKPAEAPAPAAAAPAPAAEPAHAPAPAPAPKPSAAPPKPAPAAPKAAAPKGAPPQPQAPAAHPPKAAAKAHEHAPAPAGPPLVPILLAAGLLAAAGAVWVLSRSGKQAEAPAPPPPTALAPIQAPKEMALRIAARRDAWMQLQTDGVLRFQGRAPSGFTQEWHAMDSFLLRARDPGALNVTLDGKEIALTDAIKTSSGDYKIVRP